MFSPRFARTVALVPVVWLINVMAQPSCAADGPTLLKRTVAVKLHRYLRYWPNPAAKEPQYNTYSWVPQVKLEILGPVSGGSQFSAEFEKPNGAPWMTIKMPTQEVGDDEIATIKTPDADDALEKKAITGIGTFPFKIRLKNALTGQNEVFFSGKYEVTKYPVPRVPANDKNKMDFCTVEDWRVPIGFLWLNPADDNQNTPPVSAQMWFRGASEGTEMQALLFRDGQQVDTARGYTPDEIATPSSENSTNWYLWQFTFTKVRGFNKDTSANNWAGTLFLDKSPGIYEIRVLRAGKLARVAKFSVEDGQIADNGIATKNKLGGIRQVLPVSVVGTADGTLKADSWKTHAFYGNPLAGFSASVAAPSLASKPPTPTTAAAVEETTDQPAPAGGPTLLKSTLVIRADRMQRFWQQPNTDNYWSWVPEGHFSVLGPVPAGTKFVVDFTKPNGALWTSVDCLCDAAGENEVRNVGIAGSSGHMDKRGITDVGTFGFNIRMVNEATGVKANLMRGKFTVAKFHKGNALQRSRISLNTMSITTGGCRLAICGRIGCVNPKPHHCMSISGLKIPVKTTPKLRPMCFIRASKSPAPKSKQARRAQ